MDDGIILKARNEIKCEKAMHAVKIMARCMSCEEEEEDNKRKFDSVVIQCCKSRNVHCPHRRLMFINKNNCTLRKAIARLVRFIFISF